MCVVFYVRGSLAQTRLRSWNACARPCAARPSCALWTQMQTRHYVLARGTATSASLLLEYLSSELKRVGGTTETDSTPDLPRLGWGVCRLGARLLKTSDAESQGAMHDIIHQAFVRRNVVVEFVEGASRRAHKQYPGVDTDRARGRRACNCPSKPSRQKFCGSCLTTMIWGEIHAQKNATLVVGRAGVTPTLSRWRGPSTMQLTSTRSALRP